MIKENLYKILGLPDFASFDNIKKRYRTLAFRYHPDKGGDPERMKLVNAAYDILSKRKDEYDARLRQVGIPAIIIRHRAHGWAGWGDSTNNSTVFTWTFHG